MPRPEQASRNLGMIKREITVLANEVNVLIYELASQGLTHLDDDDRMQAMDILNRIERRKLANMPVKDPAA
jgi:ribulose 1,5-bisphosphate carboxylase large subunit-like protein